MAVESIVYRPMTDVEISRREFRRHMDICTIQSIKLIFPILIIVISSKTPFRLHFIIWNVLFIIYIIILYIVKGTKVDGISLLRSSNKIRRSILLLKFTMFIYGIFTLAYRPINQNSYPYVMTCLLFISMYIHIAFWGTLLLCYYLCCKKRDNTSREVDHVLNRLKTKINLLPEDECSICLQDYKENTNAVMLTCEHKFHKSCIVEWFKKSPEMLCPLCRSDQKNIISNIRQEQENQVQPTYQNSLVNVIDIDQ